MNAKLNAQGKRAIVAAADPAFLIAANRNKVFTQIVFNLIYSFRMIALAPPEPLIVQG